MNETKLADQYSQARNAVGSILRDRWNDFSELAYARLVRSKDHRSNIRDGSLSSIIYERACRVAAQPATGRILSITRHDEGKSQLINLVWNRYCIPRMNSQYPFATKLRLWEMNSLIYGTQPMMHFYRADDDYVGPDCRLLDIRNVFPQAGRLTPNDCEYIFVEQFFAPAKIKSMKGKDGWNDKNIKYILDAADKDTVPDTSDSQTPMQVSRGENNELHIGQIKLVTKYTRGYKNKWITFAPDYGNKIVRTIPNPFPSGRIPIVFKYALPIIDSFWGLGDIERGESLQRAIDSSLNLGVDYMKIGVFPPTMFPSDANLSQYPMRAAAKWKMTSQGEPKPFKIDGQAGGIQQQLYQQFKGSMLNQNGTTDTTISSSDKQPGFGKTPDALKQLEQRENARDSWDREMLEAAEAELYEGMIEELGLKQNVPIDFNIFDEEIKVIADAGFTDVLQPFDSAVDYWVDPNNKVTNSNTGETEPKRYDSPTDAEIAQFKLMPVLNGGGAANLTVNPETLVGKYMFDIDTNSTAANDEAEEFERLKSLSEFMTTETSARAIEQLKTQGRDFDYGALLEQLVRGSNVKGSEKLFRDVPDSNSDSDSEQIDSNNPAVEPTDINSQYMNDPSIGIDDGAEQFNPDLISDPNLRNVLTAGGNNG